MSRRLITSSVAYLLPTFALGFVWHLILFKEYYAGLQIYRSDLIVPLGLLSMVIQAVIFSWLFDQTFARYGGKPVMRGLLFAATGALLSWSFTTLAVAAKNQMASVADYMLIETAFTVVQWVVVGPLMALSLSTRGAD